MNDLFVVEGRLITQPAVCGPLVPCSSEPVTSVWVNQVGCVLIVLEH